MLIVAGAWAGLDGTRSAANLPTPWMGVKERINIYGYMLWLLMLAVVLLRAQVTEAAGRPLTGIGASQLTPR